MQKYWNTVTKRSGAAVQGAMVAVTTYPLGAAATLYSDDGVTPIANPVTTDASGYFEFYAADGRYTLSVSGTGISPYTLHDVLLDDPADDKADIGLGNVDNTADADKPVSTAVRAELNARVQDIATYAALRAYAGPLTSRYVTADGMQGRFDVDASDTTSADNGGTVLVDASGRRWKREFSAPLNAKWFGARGVGTDDYLAIEAALDAAHAAGGGRVRIPAGNYGYTQNFKLQSNVHVEGDGYSTVLTALAADLRCFQNENRTGPGITDENISVRKLRISNGKALSASEFSHCFDLRYINGVAIENVWVTDAYGDGIYSLACENVVVRDVVASNCRRAGVAFTSGKHILIENIFGVALDALQGVVNLEPNPSNIIEHVTVRHVETRSGTARGLNIYGDNNDQVLDLHVENVKTNLFDIRGVTRGSISQLTITQSVATDLACEIYLCKELRIEGLRIPAAGIDAGKVKVSSSDDCSISDYTIAGPGGVSNVAFDVLNANRFTARDGAVTAGGVYGFRIRNSTDVLIDHVNVSGVSTHHIAINPSTICRGVRIRGVTVDSSGTAAVLLSGDTGEVEIDGDFSAHAAPVSFGGGFVGKLRAPSMPGYTSRDYVGTAAPTTGTWSRGDTVWNRTPSAGAALGWVCVSAGTPGTWKAMASLAP